jgi:oligopeptide/dipeptide ABC transporter ATP-binding protein
VPLVRVEGLKKRFIRPSGEPVHAVNDVSFTLDEGETLGIIGESGSGKSTVGRLVLRLLEADEGLIEIDGIDVRSLDTKGLRRMRSRMSVVFQEPYESLNPRMRVGDIVAEPIQIHHPELSKQDVRDRVTRVLEDVGLDPQYAERLPRAMSGGQQQRVGIARALSTRPKLIVLDEPTSSLDLSVQAQILEILHDLQQQFGLSYLYISHNLSTVNFIAHRVAVMYLGEFREMGTLDRVIGSPRDPYTQSLLSAFLEPDPTVSREQQVLQGEIPDPTRLPQGCFLYGRCPVRIDACKQPGLPLRSVAEGHLVRCIRADEGLVIEPASS